MEQGGGEDGDDNGEELLRRVAQRLTGGTLPELGMDNGSIFGSGGEIQNFIYQHSISHSQLDIQAGCSLEPA